ncbi:MAG TPA: amino acid adenylation domain-containing protein, partial [Marinagarivorans sp.]|nr:amino acid adenylation domain-containing protein [Marinagarivorans sp.]
ACFMPLDPSYPAERLRYMLADSAAPLVLVDAKGAAALEDLCVRCMRVDFWLADTAACAIDLSAVKRSADDPLYVMYTSGSSGDAKGVVGLQGATLNRLHWMWRQFPFASDEVCCLKTSPSFVDSIWEMLGPLLAGIPAVIAHDSVIANPAALVELLAKHRVTRLVLLPSLLKNLLNTTLNLAKRLPNLWLWTLSGEAVPTSLAADFRIRLPQSSLLNLYGSTEVAADVTYWLLSPTTPVPATATLPIGAAIDQVQLYLLDENQNPVPLGQEGELYVGGAALAQGYLHRPELTAARFLNLPQVAPGRLFRTGDRAWQMADGNWVYSGRVDDLVKVQGVQVEPAEVERALLLMDEIVDAAVLAVGQEAVQLCAFVVLRGGKRLSPEQIHNHLAHHLIAAAIPADIRFLTQLPRTPNGKIARVELAALYT